MQWAASFEMSRCCCCCCVREADKEKGTKAQWTASHCVYFTPGDECSRIQKEEEEEEEEEEAVE